MESENWESCSSDGEFNTQDLRDDEDACYSSTASDSKLQLRKASSKARWDGAIGMAEVVERKGQIWTTMGVVRNGKLYCSIEETLFLMEIGALVLLDDDGANLSLQSVYEKLAEERSGCRWESYVAYRHLKTLGYIVGRHSVPWTMKSVKIDVATDDKLAEERNGCCWEFYEAYRHLKSLGYIVGRHIIDKLRKLDLNEQKPVFDVYLPNGKFRKSAPGDPSYVLCFTRENPPSRDEVEVLARQSGLIPMKFCHVDNGRVSFFCFTKVKLPVLP